VEHAFGRATPFALGVEEELLLVKPDTLALDHRASELVPRLQQRVKYDVYEAEVETASPICRNGGEAAAALGDVRSALHRAGATLMGAGIHPDGGFGDVVHVPEERYIAIADAMRGLLQRTPTCALHVHVGMPDPETAIRAFNGLRTFLPLFQGLAAHSPYWHGRDSGFATARAQLFRGYPRAVIPPAFAGWEDYEEYLADWLRAGDIPDYTFLWWDLRPHPKLGTVELRAMDAQSSLGSIAGLAALAHGLALASAESRAPAPPPGPGLTETSFRAGRDGLRARIWWRDGLRALPEVAAEALALARPHVRAAGDEDALDEVERILREGNGADRMRAAYADGGMPAVLERLAAETAEPLAIPQA
jgi:glutamate---cysteine ligase / carboxylate-amine ligase